jgi:two-component system, cell cycle sensor histidine kinase and response regulator CckA
LKAGKDSPFYAELREVRNAGERAANLTRQLLAFSRKQVLKPEVLNLNEVMQQTETMLRRLIGEDIDLVVKLDNDLSPIKFDPGQIEQIIVNLAVNSRDAMPGGGKLTIRTANVDLDEDYVAEHPEAKTGPHVMLAISDTGSGMDAATKAKIFEPFFTTKGAGHGTGLGLSTVYGIVKQSGGNIWVYSEPGHGTTFKVYLPAAPGGRPSKARHSGALPVIRGKETVLVVEDEDAVRKLIVQVLQSAGYIVLDAGEPESAIAISREHKGPIELLLTDVVMPGMGGRQLAEALQPSRPDMLVLYMSGYTDDAIVHHGVLNEGMPFLDKPIRPRAMLEKVREVLTSA